MALASSDRVLVAWDDGTKQIPQVVVRVSSDGGAHFADAATVSASGRAAAKDKKAPKGLEAVGDSHVFVRRGVLQ